VVDKKGTKRRRKKAYTAGVCASINLFIPVLNPHFGTLQFTPEVSQFILLL